MNRTSLSVIALAVGAVLIIGLFNVYKPQVTNTAHDIFDKVHIGRMADSPATNSSKGSNNNHPTPKPKSDPNANIPDQYGVTPNEWKKGINIQLYERDPHPQPGVFGGNDDPQYNGQSWLDYGQPTQSATTFNDMPWFFSSINDQGYSTQYDKESNTLNVYCNHPYSD